jgi:xanthine dehydrogenase accessory factor
VGEDSVCAQVAGIVRGLLADGVRVTLGEKLGDVDPRGSAIDPARVSDKARAVAAGVLEAVMIGRPGSLSP